MQVRERHRRTASAARGAVIGVRFAVDIVQEVQK
jgi:hypothetical protein